MATRTDGPPLIVSSPKRSGTCPSRCPFMFRSIVKRHAMTGSRLGGYAEIRPAPGFRRGRVGPGPSDTAHSLKSLHPRFSQNPKKPAPVKLSVNR
ncbi:MAG: hypothetical protein WC626_08895 [Methanoregula sp.]